jgi:hypothetical protein
MEVLRNFEVVLAQTLNYFVRNCHFVQCHTFARYLSSYC